MNHSTYNSHLPLLQHFFFLFAIISLGLQGCTVYKDTHYPQTERNNQGAIDHLYKEAGQAIDRGKFNQAEILIERALRIEPDNAHLWHSMGIIKFNQQNYAQSVQFGLKSNSLAAGDHSLTPKNWKLIEKAYEKLGQFDKAREVHEKY